MTFCPQVAPYTVLLVRVIYLIDLGDFAKVGFYLASHHGGK